MRGILFRKAPDLAEFSARPDAWVRLQRQDAMRLFADREIVVVTPAMGPEKAEWLHGNHASMKGDAPYRLDLFRFYLRLPRKGIGSPKGSPSARPAQPDPFLETDGEPLVEKKPIPVLADPGFWEREKEEGAPIQQAAANSVLFLKVDCRELSTGDSILFQLFPERRGGQTG